MEYKPDNWVVISFPQPLGYKLLAGWSGGYLDSDRWRLNSGIVKATFEDPHWLFHGTSGSVYRCHKDSCLMRMNIIPIWAEIKELYPEAVILDEETDWANVSY